MASNETDSFHNQSVVMIMTDGIPLDLTVGDLDDFYLYSVQICIIYAAQLGASLILLVAMALLTRPERRKTPVFILNALSLIINVVRMLLLCLYFTGPFSEIYTYFAGDYSLVPLSAYATSAAAVLMTLLLITCVQVCLVIQTHVVLVTLPTLQRRGIMAFTSLVAAFTVAFRLAYSIVNIKAILALEPDSNFLWVSQAMTVVTTVSICIFSAIFVCNLGHALLRRRKMGLKTFGPMDVLLIMGGQTLIIPATFSIIQFAASDLPAMDSNVLTLVALFLPLSSLWAASIIEGRKAPAQANIPNLKADNSLDGTSFRSGGSCKPLMVGTYFGKKPSDLSSAKPSTTSSSDSPMKARFEQALVDLEKQGF